MTRTNIDLDDELIAEVMRRFGSSRHAEQRYAMHDTVDLRPVARLVRVVG